MVSCSGCARLIIGPYITALGKQWHPDCFRCAACHRPISDTGFFTQEDRPYHEACYHALFSPRCAACGKPITGPATIAKGQSWHAEHFVCDICARPIEGSYSTNAFGDTYCAHHNSDMPRCYSCHRIIAQRLTGEGVRYRDGRDICGICRRSAIDSAQLGEKALGRVRRWMARAGMDLGTVATPLRLVEQGELSRRAAREYAREPAGMACTRSWTQNGHVVKREVEEVLVLHGLPKEHFETVAAHELMHTWLFLSAFPQLPPAVEEGLCGLCEYLWLREQGTPEAARRIENMDRNDDPVYGAGYRTARRALDHYTVEGLLEYVRRYRRFP